MESADPVRLTQHLEQLHQVSVQTDQAAVWHQVLQKLAAMTASAEGCVNNKFQRVPMLRWRR